MKKIMLCIDGSPSSTFISKVLQLRQLEADAEIKVFIAVEPAGGHFFHLGTDYANHINQNERQNAEKILAVFNKELRASVPAIKIEQEILPGHPKEALLNAAEKWKPDLIVVGSRGVRQEDPFSLGSVSQTILEHADCPVLIARRTIIQQPFDVLLPMDHSSYSVAAAEWALHRSWKVVPKFHLISVVPPMTRAYTQEDNIEKAARLLHEYEQIERSAKQLLNTWAEKFDKRFGQKSAVTDFVHGEPRNTILSKVADESNCMIIMGSHGHTALTRLLLGSVSRSVSLHAGCSVEVVKRSVR